MQSTARRVPAVRHRPRRSPATLDITMRIDARRGTHEVCRGTHGDHMPTARAVALGLLSDEGYLTPLGFAFWRRTC